MLISFGCLSAIVDSLFYVQLFTPVPVKLSSPGTLSLGRFWGAVHNAALKMTNSCRFPDAGAVLNQGKLIPLAIVDDYISK